MLSGIELKMDPVELDFFLDSPATKFLVVERLKRREWVQQYFELKSKNGESRRSYEELRTNDEKFFEYTRMTVSYTHLDVYKRQASISSWLCRT